MKAAAIFALVFTACVSLPPRDAALDVARQTLVPAATKETTYADLRARGAKQKG